ncbi:MAG TPA: nucleoside 2-deoxyribosyltransferase [Chthoniobacterales bacterium]|jgi:nucleoside 2-deoxyribosyltransferase
MSSSSYSIYFAGELFSAKHLYGNVLLAEEIYRLSGGKFVSIVPQNLEQRETTAHSIRDQDIRTCLGCDVGLFHYDGPELDSGTVVEFLFAKFADIPSVLLRTDFRKGGDQGGDPWNLMTSFFPRTEVITLDAMSIYKEAFAENSAPANELLESKAGSQACDIMTSVIARKVVPALERVLAMPPILPHEKAAAVYDWLALMPGFQNDGVDNAEFVREQLRNKLARKLL